MCYNSDVTATCQVSSQRCANDQCFIRCQGASSQLCELPTTTLPCEQNGANHFGEMWIKIFISNNEKYHPKKKLYRSPPETPALAMVGDTWGSPKTALKRQSPSFDIQTLHPESWKQLNTSQNREAFQKRKVLLLPGRTHVLWTYKCDPTHHKTCLYNSLQLFVTNFLSTVRTVGGLWHLICTSALQLGHCSLWVFFVTVPFRTQKIPLGTLRAGWIP